jgi:DNA-binding transcriptional MerR regulator
MAGLLIGDVAERTGVSAPTIRYYESIGLLAPPPRSATGYRRYTVSTVEELKFIKKAQGLGFSLDEISEILKLSRAGDTPCSHVLDLSRGHLRAIDERIQQLTRFRDQLAAEIKKWDGEHEPTCRGLCQIIVNADERASNGGEIQLHVAARSGRTKSQKRRH